MGIFRWRSVIFFDKCLSNSGERQGKLLGSRRERRRLEGAIEPVAQMAVSKEVQAQEGGQIGERPLGLGEMVQPLQQQDGDEGCPNLNAQSVFAGPHEALQLEVLLQRLEKELYLPAVLVDGGNGSSSEGEQVRQQHDLPFVHRIQTVTRRRRLEQSLCAGTPVSRINWSERILRFFGTAHSSATSNAAFSFWRVTK